MTGRLAIATLCLNVSSTAFLSYNPINNLSRIIAAAVHKGTGSQANNPRVIGQKVLLLMPMELVKY